MQLVPAAEGVWTHSPSTQVHADQHVGLGGVDPQLPEIKGPTFPPPASAIPAPPSNTTTPTTTPTTARRRAPCHVPISTPSGANCRRPPRTPRETGGWGASTYKTGEATRCDREFLDHLHFAEGYDKSSAIRWPLPPSRRDLTLTTSTRAADDQPLPRSRPTCAATRSRAHDRFRIFARPARLQDVSKPEADSGRLERTPEDCDEESKPLSRNAFPTKGVPRRQVGVLRFGSFDSRAPHLLCGVASWRPALTIGERLR